MTLDKSVLTDIILILGIIITFIITYVKRQNIRFSLMFSVFYICCYCLFANYFLPFPLEFNPIFKFDEYFTVGNLFLVPDLSNIAQFIIDYISISCIALFMGISYPMIFKNCRTVKGSLKILTIPIGMNLFFFIMDLVMGGLYKYIDFMNIIFFAVGFYISFIIVLKLFSKQFNKIDLIKKGAESVNYDSIV